MKLEVMVEVLQVMEETAQRSPGILQTKSRESPFTLIVGYNVAPRYAIVPGNSTLALCGWPLYL
jgi:hypothetical protein